MVSVQGAFTNKQVFYWWVFRCCTAPKFLLQMLLKTFGMIPKSGSFQMFCLWKP